MTAPLVVAVTLNWNQCQNTLLCLESLAKALGGHLRPLVVHNGSPDGCPSNIARRFPEVEQIISPTHIGFTAGINLGLRWALERGADYIFVISNDAWIAPDALEILAAAIGPAGVGAVSPVIYDGAARQRVWSAGAGRSSLTLDLTGNQSQPPPLGRVLDREYLSVCALLLKRSTLEQVGLFDERFYIYYEDFDYCLRLRRAGLRLLLVPQARAWYHIGASTGEADSPGERYWMARSSVQFFRKHVRGWRWLVVAPYRFASALKSSVRLLRARKPDSARAYWHGLWDGLKS